MGALIISIFSHFFEEVVGKALLQFAYVIIDALSNFLLSVFSFDSIQSVVKDLPGLEGADNALLYMAFGIAIILFAIGIYQYFLSPHGSRDSVMMQIGRIAIVCFFIGKSDLVIEKVLSISYKIFVLAKNSTGEVSPWEGDAFNNLMDSFESGERDLVTHGFNALINWNSVSFVLEVILLLILAWNVFKLWLKLFERYVNFIVELYLFPVTISFMANASMQDVFFTYLRAVMSQYMILLLNIFFIKVAMHNITAGFITALLNENNVYMIFLFSLAFVKIALKMEELIRTWGLFGMSAGSVLDDAREVMQVVRDGAIFLGGSIGGRGNVTGGASSVLGKVTSAFSGKKASFGDGIGTLASGIHGMGKGIQNGNGVSGKISGAFGGFVKGITPNGTSQMKKQISKQLENRKEQKKYGQAAYNSALRAGASKKDAQIARKQAMNAVKPEKNIASAADIRKPSPIANKSIKEHAIAMCKGSPNKFVSRAPFNKVAAAQKSSLTRKLDTAQAHSLIGDKTISDSKGKSLGTCVGGQYNRASGTASLNFVKTKDNGEKEYTKATAIPLNDTAQNKGYAAEILKAADTTGIKFTESVSDDGQKWAILESNKLPKNISQEIEHRESVANTAINTDLQGANSEIRKHNTETVESVLKTNPEKFIQCNEDGSNIKYRGEADDVAAEAFRDWIAANNFAKSSSDKPYDLDSAAKDVYQSKLVPEQQEKLKTYWKNNDSTDEET